MIRWAYERARRLTSPARIATVVAAGHRQWWEDLLPSSMTGGFIVQPANRGTATGILLPLLRVLRRDRDAMVAVLPADQYVEDEDKLTASLERAFRLIEGKRRFVLLGMTPEGPDPDYGWIVGGKTDEDGTKPVLSFFEKPGAYLARDLHRRGAYWSSLVLAARGGALLALFEAGAPTLFRPLAAAAGSVHVLGEEGSELERVYATLPYVDFSRDLLQRYPGWLRVQPVPVCGWTDLGTPARLARWMRARGRRSAGAPALERSAP